MKQAHKRFPLLVLAEWASASYLNPEYSDDGMKELIMYLCGVSEPINSEELDLLMTLHHQAITSSILQKYPGLTDFLASPLHWQSASLSEKLGWLEELQKKYGEKVSLKPLRIVDSVTAN